MTDPTRDALLMAVAEATAILLQHHILHHQANMADVKPGMTLIDLHHLLAQAQRERDNPPEAR